MSERDRKSMGTDDPADAGLSRLYREGAREVPPPHVDTVIRAAARREVGARPHRAGTFAVRWRLPLALAAVLVLSVSLVTLIMDEGGEELLAPPAPKAEAPTAGESPARAPAEMKSGGTVGSDDRRNDRAQPSAAQPEAAVRPFPAAPAASAPPRPEAALRERAREPAFDKPEAPLAQRAPAAMADKLAAEESRAAAGALRREAVADEARPRSSSPALSPAVARQVQALEGEVPEKWLERIAQLRREGGLNEADELLGEFKRRFPGHPLPPDVGK
ncbi:MAG: hypothetical protein OEZ08_04770 [Betaproteobacteria bacterium]|nr:hypothetical protein [Betaproteobacteria bacterium]